MAALTHNRYLAYQSWISLLANDVIARVFCSIDVRKKANHRQQMAQ